MNTPEVTPIPSPAESATDRYERALAAFADAIPLWTTNITVKDFS